MTTTTLPAFKGKSLIEIPVDIPQANFLEGDFGKAVLDDYKRITKSDYGNAKCLKVLGYDNRVLGSNPFAVVLVNQIIREQGLRTATQADLERILKVNALDLRGTSEDSALVLRTDGDSYKPNDYLAKNLTRQLKERRKTKWPTMITLSDLDLVKDEASHYGLAFKIRDDAKIVHVPILNKSGGNFDSKKIDEKTGLPTKVGKGDRFLHTKQDGLSGLLLGRGLGLYSNSDWDYLDSSSSGGRVVVVSGSSADVRD